MSAKIAVSALAFCACTILSIPALSHGDKNQKPKTKPAATPPVGNHRYNPARVSIGPYLNQDWLFDGSELLINTPSIREDVRLLLAQAKLLAEVRALGIPEPPLPRLVFSGKLEGQASFTKTYAGANVNNIDFSGAELDTYVQANDWVSGYMALDYDPSEAMDGSRVFLNRAFITIGNLSKLPVYTTIGQIYVPFGRYSSAMVTTPSTLGLGRTRVRALVLGYQQTGDNAFHAEAYAYQGLTNPVNNSNINDQWGSDAGYQFDVGKVSGEVGASYISNLGDSQGMQASVFSTDQTQHHNVPAFDVYGSLAFKPLVFLAEYVDALKSFQFYDMNFANQGAWPKAFHVEADYTFNTGSKPSSIGVAYDQTSEALAVGLPKNSYSIFYNVNIWSSTNFALEYRHNVNYPPSAATNDPADPTPASITGDLGKTDNIVTASFDLFF